MNTKRNEEGLPVEIHLGDRIASNSLEKCNLLAEHFKSIFNDTTASLSQVAEAVRDTPSDAFNFSITSVTVDLVESAIKKLKFSNAAGPDGIPSSILKRCCSELTTPLSKLFNISLQQGEFPTRWKSSFMFPIYKKGDKRNVENYRGITSLSACSKVFEIIINDALFSSCRNYISPDQHGFYPKRSVSTNLAPFISLCLRSMEAGAQVDVVYTDLKAAFDRVDHSILLAKLEKLGVSSGLTRWFKSYLTNRELCVRIGLEQSDYFTNSSGVPQGSNLGPLLFSIFVNEAGLILPTGCRSFYADDVKIYVIVRSFADCLRLQHLIDTFEEWCSRNYLTLNVQKCNIISFHRKLKPVAFNYTINHQLLQRVDNVRDLGITLDCALTFKLHYSGIVAKANRQLGFIFKIADEFRDPACLKALYCSLVRSILEFSSVVWCPYQAVWIARIESVQRKFVRYAFRHLPWNDPVNLPPYEDRCQLLGLETLEHRRTISQAVFAAKVLIGDIDSPGILAEFEIYAPERVLRSRSFLHLGPRAANYSLHDPIRFMSGRFNEFYEFFDFNCAAETFRHRIQRRLLRR